MNIKPFTTYAFVKKTVLHANKQFLSGELIRTCRDGASESIVIDDKTMPNGTLTKVVSPYVMDTWLSDGRIKEYRPVYYIVDQYGQIQQHEYPTAKLYNFERLRKLGNMFPSKEAALEGARWIRWALSVNAIKTY